MKSLKEIGNIAKSFDSLLISPKQFSQIFNVTIEDAKEQVELIGKIKTRAIQGQKEDRLFMIQKLSRYIDINKEYTEECVCDIENNVLYRFYYIFYCLDFAKWIERYEIETEFNIETMTMIEAEAKEKLERFYKQRSNRISFLATYIFFEMYGVGVVDFIETFQINEVGFIRKDYIYCVLGAKKIWISFLSYEDVEMLIKVQKKSTMLSNLTYDQHNPICIASLRNANRVAVAGYDVTPSESACYFNKRVFNMRKVSLEELCDKWKTLDKKMVSFLSFNQAARGSVLVTGSDMNVGKSTLLMALISKLPLKYAIGILDPQNEMRLMEKYPEKNVITLISNEKRDTHECFEYLLKTSRDILCVSEITNPIECANLMNAALRLNCGVCATMHTFSCDEVMTNLRNLMLRTDMYKRADVAECDAARSIDLIIHLARDKNRIVIESIDEVVYLDQNVLIGSVKEMIKQCAIKYLNRKSYKLNRLFSYENGSFRCVNNVSDRYMKKIEKGLDEDYKEAFLSFVKKEMV